MTKSVAEARSDMMVLHDNVSLRPHANGALEMHLLSEGKEETSYRFRVVLLQACSTVDDPAVAVQSWRRNGPC